MGNYLANRAELYNDNNATQKRLLASVKPLSGSGAHDRSPSSRRLSSRSAFPVQGKEPSKIIWKSRAPFADELPIASGDQLLDRYEIAEVIDIGGNAVVYAGHDTRLERPVCIKVLRDDREEEASRYAAFNRFLREAFILSELTHPNILRIFDLGYMLDARRSRDLPFMVLEYMGGGTLTTSVRCHGPHGVKTIAGILRAIGGVLDELHRKGIVHCDVKPANLLFDANGIAHPPKLCDLGSSEITDACPDAAKWTKKFPLGARRLRQYTMCFAAPEQLVGEEPTPQTDIYQLALTAFFGLTAQSLFHESERSEALAAREHAAAKAASILSRQGFSSNLVDIIEWGLRESPDERPSSVVMFYRAFSAAAFESSPARRNYDPVRLQAMRAMSFPLPA